jgi:hypothetical protein
MLPALRRQKSMLRALRRQKSMLRALRREEQPHLQEVEGKGDH